MATARRRLSPVKQRLLDGRIAERGLYSSPAPAGTALAGGAVADSGEEIDDIVRSCGLGMLRLTIERFAAMKELLKR